MLRHCNSVNLYEKIYVKKTQKHLKDVVRDYYRKEREKWIMYLDPNILTAPT